jgi:hypothetical protein
MKHKARLFLIPVMIFAALILIFSLDSMCQTAKAQGIGTDTHLLRKSTTMPDGRIKVGDLIVQEGKDGQEAKVKTIRFDATGNGKQGWMTMTELGQISAGRSELQFTESRKPDDDKLYYGVSMDNKLLVLVKGAGNKVKVVRDLNGVYDIENIDKHKVILVDGVRMADGRIKVAKE